MREHVSDSLLEERIRQLAVEQMSQEVPSIILTRLANGNIEVSVVRELTDFGRPPEAFVDRNTLEFIRNHKPRRAHG